MGPAQMYEHSQKCNKAFYCYCHTFVVNDNIERTKHMLMVHRLWKCPIPTCQTLYIRVPVDDSVHDIYENAENVVKAHIRKEHRSYIRKGHGLGPKTRRRRRLSSSQLLLQRLARAEALH